MRVRSVFPADRILHSETGGKAVTARKKNAGAKKRTVTLADLRARREEILRLAASHGASNIRIFGSVARGEAGANSDVDLLVEFEPGRSLLDLAGLELDLQDLLGCKVDVGTQVREIIRDRVEREAVPL
jgi:predicted nucleotidyltransferase